MRKFHIIPSCYWFYSLTTLTDRIILALAIVLLVWLYKYYWLDKSQLADYALIFVDNQAPLRIKLQSAQQIHIQGRLGPSIIEITEGGIRFLTSPCRSKQCIHRGWLSASGDFAACLPNRVRIELHSVAKTTAFDSIVY